MRGTGDHKPGAILNINLNKWFTLRFGLAGGDSGGAIFTNERERSVKTALLVIMVIFFAGLALDIATLAAALTAFILFDRAISPLVRGQQAEGRAS